MRSLVLGALGITIALLVGSCSSSPMAPMQEPISKVTRKNLPMIFVYPDGEGQSETQMSGVYTSQSDPSSTVQVVDLGGQTYYRRSYVVYQMEFITPTRAYSVGTFEQMQTQGTISDTTTVWTMEDSVLTTFEPIDLNGTDPNVAAAAAAQPPPPPPPPVQVPPPVTDSTQAVPGIKKVTWGEVKKRWR
jgi:hypothetical protein